MKQPYSKPTVAVEILVLDSPIAANCTADKDDILSLKELGYLVGDSCNFGSIDQSGIVDPLTGDTVCYHSNVQTVLNS